MLGRVWAQAQGLALGVPGEGRKARPHLDYCFTAGRGGKWETGK